MRQAPVLDQMAPKVPLDVGTEQAKNMHTQS